MVFTFSEGAIDVKSITAATYAANVEMLKVATQNMGTLDRRLI